MLGRRKSYLLSSTVKKEQEEAAKVQLPTRFRRIVLVAEAREELSKWRVATSASQSHAPALALPSPGRAHRHSDSEVDFNRPNATDAARGAARSLADMPPASTQLSPRARAPALPAGAPAAAGGDRRRCNRRSDSEVDFGHVSADAIRNRSQSLSDAPSASTRPSPPEFGGRRPRSSRGVGDGDAASALSLNSTMSIEQSDVDTARMVAEQAWRKAGERYRADLHAREEESTDKRYIELTRGGAFLLASASPTRRASRVENGGRAPRSSLEHILMPALALAATTPPEGGAYAAQTYAEYVERTEQLDPRRQYVAIVAVGKVPRQAIRAARFAAKALVGLEVVVLMGVTPARRGARRPTSDDIEAAAREATKRAERQRSSAIRLPAPGAEPRQLRTLLATIALSEFDPMPAAAAQPPTRRARAAAETAPLVTVSCEASDEGALGQRLDVNVVVREVQRAISRILGVEPCGMYACALAADDDRAAPHVCPICLRKLLWTTNMSLDAHVAAQREAKGCVPDAGAPAAEAAGAPASAARVATPGDSALPSRPASSAAPRRRSSCVVELEPIRLPSRPFGAVALSRRRSL